MGRPAKEVLLRDINDIRKCVLEVEEAINNDELEEALGDLEVIIDSARLLIEDIDV